MGERKFVKLIHGVDGYYPVDDLYPPIERRTESQEEFLQEQILAYETITKIVYYQYVEHYHLNLYVDERIGYLAPYISENGKFCRFIDGKLVEIG